jgi:hypothetical protein
VNEATVRLLTRHDIEVVNVAGSGCCGSSVLHVGRNEQAIELAKANITAWLHEIDGAGLDAIVINASGCGTTVKDYGNMLAAEPEWHAKAERVAKLAKDVSEVMAEVGLANVTPRPLTVAYHSACSMQHGQKVIEPPKKLLREAGFTVKDVPEGHLCCGWAGTYQVLQPELSRRLRDRKVARRHRFRQFRLYRQHRLGHRHTDRPYGRAARLGDGRSEARGARLAALFHIAQQSREQGRELPPLVIAQRAEQFGFDGHVLGERGVDRLQPVRRQPHQCAAPVGLRHGPLDEPLLLQPVQAIGQAARGDHQRLIELGRALAVRRAGPLQRRQHIEFA